MSPMARVLRSESMLGKIDAYMAELKSKIPAADHAALESRLDALLNDPDADASDVVSVLRREFDPESG
jgi:ATP-dependent exoDNAse (exonuclease V) beta subunit